MRLWWRGTLLVDDNAGLLEDTFRFFCREGIEAFPSPVISQSPSKKGPFFNDQTIPYSFTVKSTEVLALTFVSD